MLYLLCLLWLRQLLQERKCLLVLLCLLLLRRPALCIYSACLLLCALQTFTVHLPAPWPLCPACSFHALSSAPADLQHAGDSPARHRRRPARGALGALYTLGLASVWSVWSQPRCSQPLTMACRGRAVFVGQICGPMCSAGASAAMSTAQTAHVCKSNFDRQSRPHPCASAGQCARHPPAGAGGGWCGLVGVLMRTGGGGTLAAEVQER